MDQEVKDFIAMWKTKKDSFADDWKRGTPSGRGRWTARLAETRFVYKGMEYSLKPEDMGLDRDDPWDQGFMEFMQYDIENDLRKMGSRGCLVHGHKVLTLEKDGKQYQVHRKRRRWYYGYGR